MSQLPRAKTFGVNEPWIASGMIPKQTLSYDTLATQMSEEMMTISTLKKLDTFSTASSFTLACPPSAAPVKNHSFQMARQPSTCTPSLGRGQTLAQGLSFCHLET